MAWLAETDDMARADHRIVVAGVSLVADRAGALVLPDQGALLVSDLHLEKGSSLARRGVFLPPWDTAATLAALERGQRGAVGLAQPVRPLPVATAFTTGRGRTGWARPTAPRWPRSSAAATGCGSPAITIRPCRGSAAIMRQWSRWRA
jgi:hypothetical protein